jgi:hypothetical protein
LCHAHGGGPHLGLGLFELELKVDGVEHEEWLALADEIAVLNQPLRNLAMILLFPS